MMIQRFPYVFALVFVLFAFAHGQDKSLPDREDVHKASVYGVEIGMDVESALRAVFKNANRKPGDEKPDALRREGKNDRDIRVVYKELPLGELQLVFANGRFVREIRLRFISQPNVDDLRLPFTSSLGTGDNRATSGGGPGTPAVREEVGSIEEFSANRIGSIDARSGKRLGNIDRSRSELMDGATLDDRYTVGFADRLRQQRIWWRDEESDDKYSVRVFLIGRKLTTAGGRNVPTIEEKLVTLSPKDKDYFYKKQ